MRRLLCVAAACLLLSACNFPPQTLVCTVTNQLGTFEVFRQTSQIVTKDSRSTDWYLGKGSYYNPPQGALCRVIRP